MDKVKIAVSGAGGRMGKRIIALLAKDGRCALHCALECGDCEALGKDAGEIAGAGPLNVKIGTELCRGCDVLIDFTLPQPCIRRIQECVETNTAAVIGTTGFDDRELAEIKKIAQNIPVLLAPNMSLGVNLMFELSAQVAAALGQGYDIEIVEAHHREKKDAPSGTAKKLAERICAARDWSYDQAVEHGREGMVGRRQPDKLGMHAVRGGDIVGEHTVIYAGDGERLEITHRAGSRDVFASGAVNAAKCITKQNPGLYDMADLLKRQK